MDGKTPDILSVDNLSFSYGESPLLNVERFSANARERIGVLGPSGCGKTTFIHLIAGLLRPQLGTISINGHEISTMKEAAIDRIRGKHMGIVFQRLHLMPAINVLDNLLLAQRMARSPIDGKYALQLLAQLGIEDLAQKKPQTLSQGQAQRVAIARSLAHRPSLLVADEPTSALDDNNAMDALDVLCELTESTGAALIIVTHDDRVKDRIDSVFSLGAEK